VAKTGTGITVTTAEQWAEQYPNQYETYMANSENDEVVEYTETNPYITTLYEGYGFAKSYGSARGHTYVIDDLYATGRPHKLANCFTCKTSSFTAAALNDASAYAGNFDDFKSSVEDPFGCFHCHENTPGEMVVTHTYLADALGDDLESVPGQTLSCGQCHSEYYFDPETKATSFDYTSLDTMNPDDMLEYMNSLTDTEGNLFADWVDEDTGVRKIKVQHPEFETFLGEGSPHASTFTCADCHMGETTADDGTTYTNHYWSVPTQNEELYEASCAACHGSISDFQAAVKATQDETTAREDEIGQALADFDGELAQAIADGKIEGEDLETVRMLCRNAQWYWDFVFVENSEGVHNPTLTKKCLDQAESILEEAKSYLK